ncbi:hypothetical protein cypCar_00038341 [Cyprinus carpio]|nr:hypothetical protein cypCar_00038341 [Cyprinus carpio]
MEKVESWRSLEEDWDFLPSKKIKDPRGKEARGLRTNRRKIDRSWRHKTEGAYSVDEDWDKPENIPDPDAKKPDDWDEDMDGEWEPAMIPNPEYKGEWKPKQIDNPNYKGTWIHPEIDNPEYSPDDSIYKFDNIGVLGLDLWQVKTGTIFDNFLITDDVEEAEQFGTETWGATKGPEKKMKDQQEEEERKKREEEEKSKKDDDNEEDEEDGDEAEDEEHTEEPPEEEEEEGEDDTLPKDEL